jgi:hypothetical protein
VSTFEDNVAKAREHYNTRASRRPRQTWNEDTKEWIHHGSE